MLIHKRPCLAVGVRNMDKRFLGRVKNIGNGGQVVTLKETVAYAKAFQPFITVELLIVVVVYCRLKHSLVLWAHNRDGIATEI